MSRGHHHTTACALTWRSSSPDSRAWHRHVCTCTKLADPQAAERAGPRCILTSVVYTYLRRWSSPSSYIGTWWWPARAGPFTEGAETHANRPPLYGTHTVRPPVAHAAGSLHSHWPATLLCIRPIHAARGVRRGISATLQPKGMRAQPRARPRRGPPVDLANPPPSATAAVSVFHHRRPAALAQSYVTRRGGPCLPAARLARGRVRRNRLVRAASAVCSPAEFAGARSRHRAVSQPSELAPLAILARTADL